MSKGTGLGDNFYVAGVDVSGDVNSLSRIGGGLAPIDMTDITQSAYERQGGLRDGAIAWSSYFDPDVAHPLLSALPVTDVHVMYCRGTTLGNHGAALVAKQVGYDPARPGDGSLLFGVQALANRYGLEWGRQLTAGKRTDTGATAGTGVDLGTGSTTHGLQAYLQVFSMTGTDATVKIQESSDNGSGDAWADVTGGAFTELAAGPAVERIATATDLTVERYLRAVTTTSAGFTSLVFALLVVRNDTEVTF